LSKALERLKADDDFNLVINELFTTRTNKAFTDLVTPFNRNYNPVDHTDLFTCVKYLKTVLGYNNIQGQIEANGNIAKSYLRDVNYGSLHKVELNEK